MPITIKQIELVILKLLIKGQVQVSLVNSTKHKKTTTTNSSETILKNNTIKKVKARKHFSIYSIKLVLPLHKNQTKAS